MASISKRMVSGQPRYDVNYRDPDGRGRRRTFKKRSDADDFMATVETDKLRGTFIDPSAGKITFEKFAKEWLAQQTTEESTRESTALRLRVHINPALGRLPLSQIRPSTIQAWLRGLTMSQNYRRVLFANVSTILSAAVDDELIAKNPCKAGSVRPPRAESHRIVPWTSEQVRDVTAAIPERFRIAATLGAGLGLRQGEVFGLSPDDVDFLRGTVQVRRQVKILGGNKQVFGLPKGNKTRTVPLPGSVRDLLAAHLAAHPARPVTLPWKSLEGEPTTVPLILSTRESTALNRNYFNGFIWKKALVKAGVETNRENGMHALRHYYASVLLDGGESIKAVADYLGHADPGFTLRTYTHMMPGSATRTRSAVDDALTWYIGGTSGSGGASETE